jgi:hypothetical protein
MNYSDLLERDRRRLIWVADAIVDDNPLWLLRLPRVGVQDVLPLHTQLKALFTTRPVYYEQVFNTLRDNKLLNLLEEA